MADLIAAGSAGIGSAVAATRGDGNKRVAVLGAGEAARPVARQLTKRILRRPLRRRLHDVVTDLRSPEASAA